MEAKENIIENIELLTQMSPEDFKAKETSTVKYLDSYEEYGNKIKSAKKYITL